MKRSLREIYDSLYIGTELLLHQYNFRKIAKHYAKLMPKNPEVTKKYNSVIRPYWNQFKVRPPKKYWFYLLANEHVQFSEKYIPDDLWARRIVPYYNNLLFEKPLQDKNLLDIMYPEIKHPATPVRCIFGNYFDGDMNRLTEAEAAEHALHHGRILVKPSVGSGEGHGITFYDSDTMSADDMLQVFRKYGKHFIVQEKLHQHPDLARLSGDSVNTLRITTFYYKDEVHILSSILRVGGSSGELDNISQGGYQNEILPDGRLATLGFTHHNGPWEYTDHYATGIRFEDVVVPSYDRVLAAVKELAEKTAHFRIVGWDIAIDSEGDPVMIEYNVIPGQAEETNGPTLGALTDEVLEEVFGRRS